MIIRYIVKIYNYFFELWITYMEIKNGTLVIKPCHHCKKKEWFSSHGISNEDIKNDNVTWLCKSCFDKTQNLEL